MPFELFEFLEQFMIGSFLIILTRLEKIGLAGKAFSAENLQLNPTFETRNSSRFLHHFRLSNWVVLFTSLSADEFELNSKSAYIPNCIHKVINFMNAHL